jgi:lysophospholipase L1-like esterase
LYRISISSFEAGLSSILGDNGGTGASTRHALRKLAIVALSVAGLSLLTYALPSSERLRPWVAGEGVPIARMFADEESALPGFAEASTQTHAAANEAAVPSSGALATRPDVHGGGMAQPHGGASGPALQIERHEYDGISQHIENAKALDALFAKLVRVGARQPAAIARIAHYGDSSIAADSITSTARRLLQRRFGDSGHGFVLISRGYMHYLHKDVVHRSSRGWELHPVVQASLRPGFYGYGGVQARGGGGEHVTFATVKEGEFGRSVSRFELFFQRFRGAGNVELKIDGKRHSVLETRGERVEDAWHVVEVPDGPHSLTIRTLGAVTRLYGVALERETPGVVYDSLGLVGAMADRLLNAEPEHIRRQIAHRAPDLLVLGFGGNESGNKWLNIEQYERELAKVVELMRAGRQDMSCMLFGPLDQAERDARGRVVTLATVPKITEAQRRVAKAHGCAFFDAFSAMGGNGSMAKWQRTRPRLATSDLRHATPAGYELIGNMYYKALLEAFANYLAARRSA